MEVYTIDSTLNLMLLCVELTNIILCNDKSTSSFILDLVVHEPTAHESEYQLEDLHQQVWWNWIAVTSLQVP